MLWKGRNKTFGFFFFCSFFMEGNIGTYVLIIIVEGGKRQGWEKGDWRLSNIIIGFIS